MFLLMFTFYHFHRFSESRQGGRGNGHAHAVHGSVSGPVHNASDPVSHYRNDRQRFPFPSALRDCLLRSAALRDLVHFHKNRFAGKAPGAAGDAARQTLPLRKLSQSSSPFCRFRTKQSATRIPIPQRLTRIPGIKPSGR